MPQWLTTLSIISLCIGGLCALIILCDLALRPQHMWVMNIVWPVTALFGTFLAVWAYFRYGTLASKPAVEEAERRGQKPPNKRLTPFPMMVGKGTTHCGSGCALGDLCAEWLVFFVPVVAAWFGYKTLFEHKIFAVWIVDYLFAFAFGVAFQYFTIKPMRELSIGRGLIEAVKADALSLTAWQVGMYGFMAVAHFWIFKSLLGRELKVHSAAFWFMMQIAMLAGFVTSYPVNWWLIRREIKEKM